MGERESKFTAKIFMKVLALLGILFVFLPSFVVSCSGEDLNVSAMTAVTGTEMTDPNPLALLCLIIPAAVIVLLTIKKFDDAKTAKIILAISVVDLIVWLVFRSKVKSLAEEYMCEFRSTMVFYINVLRMLLTIGVSTLLMMKNIPLDAPLQNLLGGFQGKELTKMKEFASAMKNKESVQSAEDAAPAENVPPVETNRFCTQCGSKLSPEAKFCVKCGQKAE